jgi:hypothetical protein
MPACSNLQLGHSLVVKCSYWNFCKKATSRTSMASNITDLLDFDQNHIAIEIAIVVELFEVAPLCHSSCRERLQ